MALGRTAFQGRSQVFWQGVAMVTMLALMFCVMHFLEISSETQHATVTVRDKLGVVDIREKQGSVGLEMVHRRPVWCSFHPHLE